MSEAWEFYNNPVNRTPTTPARGRGPKKAEKKEDMPDAPRPPAKLSCMLCGASINSGSYCTTCAGNM